MRVVLDTNVLVSGLMKPTGPPGLLMDLALAGALVALHDGRVLGEYREVRVRPELGLNPESVAKLLEAIEKDGEAVVCTPAGVQLPDPDDQAFLEVALSGHADALVTGNRKHFPDGCGIAVLSPRELLERLA